MEDLYFGGEQPTVGGRVIMEDLYFGGEQPTVGGRTMDGWPDVPVRSYQLA